MQRFKIEIRRICCGVSLLLLLIIVCAAGCSDRQPFAQVSGKVSLQGKTPDSQGLMIVFLSQTGEVVAANVELDGTYHAPKVPVGEVRVGFTIAGLGEAPLEEESPSPPNSSPVKPSNEKPKSPYDQENLPIPAQYLDPFMSGLKFTVQSDEKFEFNPDLK